MLPTTSSILIRRYQGRDHASVVELLRIVPLLYPNGRTWLERMLDNVDSRRSFCTLAFHNNVLGGAIIDVSKGRRTRKIATFYVSKTLSNYGLGSHLYSRCHDRWIKDGIDSLYVTVASERQHQIDRFLFRRGFTYVTTQHERYGPNRHEIVYSASLP
jgi:N-acetylglutamate synthase-like GNAT family acetyltransferase